MLTVKQKSKIFLSVYKISRRTCVSVSRIHHPVTKPVDITKTTRPTKSFKEIPGPSSLPLFGPLLHFLPGGALYNLSRAEMFAELYRQYGPIVRLDNLANQPDTVFLFDADSIRTVFRAQETSPHRGLVGTLEMYRHKVNKQHYIGVIINGYGDEWRNFRSVANKVMMDPKIVQASYSETIDTIAKEAVERFKSVRNEKGEITNLNDEMRLWALETSTAVALGQRLHCLTRKLPEDSDEKRLIALIHETLQIVETADFKHSIFQNLFYRQDKKVMKVYSELERLVLHFIGKSLAMWESKKTIDNDIHAATIEKILYKNKTVALGLAIDVMIAGLDAVTEAMIFLLYSLGSNPDQQRNLREEVLSGKDQKPYLRACLKESARLIPTTVANTRIATKAHEVLGYEIPEKTLIVVPQQIMSTMESHYPRATEFIPERWLVGKEHPLYYGNAHPFTYMPFGFGIRSCLGQRIVDLMMNKLTVKMMENFEVIWEGPPPEQTQSSFNRMKKPYRFIFKSLH